MRCYDPILQTEIFGRRFNSPVGLAAGFDKNAESISAAVSMGFDFVEIGTVTPEPQPGNPKPRVFRSTVDEAVINRYGFNSDGAEVVFGRVQRWRLWNAKVQNFVAAMKSLISGDESLESVHRSDQLRSPVSNRLNTSCFGKEHILGINIGKNKQSPDAISDYVRGAQTFYPVADYIVINISSPNTPGLRSLQAKDELTELIRAVQGTMKQLGSGRRGPSLLVKVAPDLSAEQRADVAQVALQMGIDGLIVSNTTLGRPASLAQPFGSEAGGLSGAPLRDFADQSLLDFYRLTNGRIPLIGVGGISSAEDAYRKIRLGASLVQLYTGLVFHGPGLPTQIKRGIADLLRKDGFQSISEAVGIDAHVDR